MGERAIEGAAVGRGGLEGERHSSGVDWKIRASAGIGQGDYASRLRKLLRQSAAVVMMMVVVVVVVVVVVAAVVAAVVSASSWAGRERCLRSGYRFCIPDLV
jgi:hypothetical protein